MGLIDPFQLTVDGDKLYGRGTTASLGHVALITQFFERLATLRPATKQTIVCVLIASAEADSTPVAACGIEVLLLGLWHPLLDGSVCST